MIGFASIVVFLSLAFCFVLVLNSEEIYLSGCTSWFVFLETFDPNEAEADYLYKRESAV